MNYVSLCKRLAVCTALGIALSLPVGAVWNTMQPQLAYAEEYSSLRGNIIENAYLLVGTPFKMGGSFPSVSYTHLTDPAVYLKTGDCGNGR